MNDSETDYPELVLKIDDDVDEVVGLDSCSQGEKVCCPTDHVLSEEVTVQVLLRAAMPKLIDAGNSWIQQTSDGDLYISSVIA